MSQSKKHSVMEAVSSTIVGFLFTWFASLVIYPMVGIAITPSQNVIVILLFTLVSVVRGYVLRRFFNRLTVQKNATAVIE